MTYDYWKGASLDTLSDEAIDAIVSIMSGAVRGTSIGLGHYMHGEICRARAGTTALPRAAGQWTYFVDANWRDAARAEPSMAWVDNACATMRPLSGAGTYVNYLSSDSDDAVRSAYQGNYARLLNIKRKFDPSNVFHLNRNVRPR